MMKALHKLAVVLIMILILGGCQERSAAYNKIDRLINERFPADGPGVAVFVAAPGLGRQQFAAGLSDVAENKAMRSDDPFRIGALTQAFTSTLILQLIEQGTVALDDTLEKWLPVDLLDSVPNGRSVTIRQLLTMTSGIPDYQNHPGFQTAVAADPQRLWQPEEILAFSARQAPDFAPGERFGYSAANYVLLQMVAEAATGETLASNFRERFFYRLNMDNSYLEREEALPEGHVPGYTTANGTAEIVSGKRDGLGLGSDGIVAPVSDLRRFAPALATRQLTGNNADETYRTTEIGEGLGYGLGIMKQETPWGNLWGYSGASAGTAGVMWYMSDPEVTLVLLSNDQEAQARVEQLALDIMAIVLEN